MKKGNLYYYFKNKEEILFACHQYSLDQLTAAARRRRAERPAARREAAAPDRRVRPHDPRRAARHGAVPRARGAHAGAPESGHRPPRQVRSRRAAGARGRDGGGRRSRRGNPKLLAFALFGAVNWIPRWYNPDGAASSQEIAELFADFSSPGCGPRTTLAREHVRRQPVTATPAGSFESRRLGELCVRTSSLAVGCSHQRRAAGSAGSCRSRSSAARG